MLLDSIIIDKTISILLVIDVQKDFAVSKAGFAFFDRQKREKRDDVSIIQSIVKQKIVPFVERAKKAGLRIVYFKSEYVNDQFSDMPRLCIKGSKGAELFLVGQNISSKETIFSKYNRDPFNGNEFMNFLKKHNVNQLLMVGGTIDGCVNVAVFNALIRGLEPIVLSDCVYTAGYKWDIIRLKKLKEFEESSNIKLIKSEGIKFH